MGVISWVSSCYGLCRASSQQAVPPWGIIAKAGLEKWHKETIGERKTELAEEVLARMYQALDVIQAVRSPVNFSNEGSTRQKAEWETKDDTAALSSYFAAIERKGSSRCPRFINM